ncbi:hypothetical protein ACP70R_012137 [Stipagrostis hirtigluma subsp. patula]
MGRTKQSSSSWYSRRRSSSAPATPREVADPPIGCMSMVHYLIFAPGAGCVGRPPATSNGHAAVVAPRTATNYDHQHDAAAINGHHRQRDTDGKGGTEAPRNSLDLDADGLGDIQIGVQVEPVFDALARTSMRRARATAPSSEAETPRTPSLVARLMGIDGLPDQSSPSPALSKHRASTGSTQKPAPKKESNCSSAPSSAGKEKKKRVIPESMNRREPLRSLSCNVPAGDARSLPDTPRGSTSARASWDGPRLSLQALKENVLDRAAQYMSLPSSPTSSAAGKKKKLKDAHGRRARNDEERERTAKEHAREIVRQAKETVAKRKSKNNAAAKSSPVAAQKQSTSNKENERPPATSSAMEDSKFMAPVVVVQPEGKSAVARPPKAQSTEQPPVSHVHRVPLAPKQPPPPPPPQRAKPSRPPPPPPPLC